MNNTLKQFAACSLSRYAVLNAGKRRADAALKSNPENYLQALLNKKDIPSGDLSLSAGSNSVCAAALYSFYDNLAEQLELFKTKTDQSEIKTKKVASASGDNLKQQEESAGQAESSEQPGQEQPSSQQQNQQIDEQQIDEQQTAEQQTNMPGQPADFAEALISLINNARRDSGLAPLSLNPTLNSIAGSRCDDMLARDYFSHVSPDGKDIKAILAENGIMYKVTGENLQYCFPPSMASPELFFNSWMDSEIHRANMLGSGYTQIGIALRSNADKAIAALVFLG